MDPGANGRLARLDPFEAGGDELLRGQTAGCDLGRGLLRSKLPGGLHVVLLLTRCAVRPRRRRRAGRRPRRARSEEHTSELQSLMRISYAVFCLKKKTYI